MTDGSEISLQKSGDVYALTLTGFGPAWALFSALLAAKFSNEPKIYVLTSPHVNGILNMLATEFVSAGKLPKSKLEPDIIPPEFFVVAREVYSQVHDGELGEVMSLDDALRAAFVPYHLENPRRLLENE